MQVANTLNNTIRILFNPRVEPFKLFDFLVVKSDDNRYVAQIIEIYDDKFDGSQNVAKIKLFYRINENDEVTPYDNFTPNKECEIVKIKHEEIENFVNQDNETFVFGTNIKNSSSLNLQYKFFDNNAIVLADKVENAVCMTYNLAKKLSSKKNVVIIDSTGSLELEGAKKIKASKNFKMPLNYTTIEHVFNKCLADSSLEFQAIGGEIISEIKRFAKKQEGQFIPFNMLTKVLLEQYNATPYPELKVLLMRIKKFQMDDVFAKNKNDKDNLLKAIEKNPITIIDLSTINPYWQKTYLDYITSEIEQEVYLITRINDEHFDTNLINKIYSKKQNISFVPTVSYNYKKLPTVMQYCKNYILMPSLQQRNDFLDANFALANLIPEGCIIFGKNTDNFLYLARDYELEIQESKKNYKKIELSNALAQNPMQHNLDEKSDYYEKKEQEERLKEQEAQATDEIANFKTQKPETFAETVTFAKAPIQEVAPQKSKENFEVIENPIEDLKNVTIEEDYFASIEEDKDDTKDEFEEIEVKKEEVELKEENDFFENLETTDSEDEEDSEEEEESEEETEEEFEEEDDDFEEISDSEEDDDEEYEEESEEEDEEEGLTFEDLVSSREKKTENELEETSEQPEEKVAETVKEQTSNSILDEFLSTDEIMEAEEDFLENKEEPSQEPVENNDEISLEESIDEIFEEEKPQEEASEEIIEEQTEKATIEQAKEVAQEQPEETEEVKIEQEETLEIEELEIQTEENIEISEQIEEEKPQEEVVETQEAPEPPVEKAEQYEMGVIEFDVKEEVKEEPKETQDTLQIDNEEITLKDDLIITDTELTIETEELNILSEDEAPQQLEPEKEDVKDEVGLIAQDEQPQEENILVEEQPEQEVQQPQDETQQTQEVQEENEEEFGFSDDELDFFEMADADFDEEENEEANDEEENEESSISFDDDEEDVDLESIADSSIDNSFEEIINSKAKQGSTGVSIDENTKIDIDIVNSQSEENNNLPIFKEKREKAKVEFKKGDRVVHPRFGAGEIKTIIPIEGGKIGYAVLVKFDDGTEKPLEPISAKLELEQ
ncbi:MAG: hypothetical protein IJW73_01695 [Candidatus Gastranaerophilales bacterium]|nr:hypothetical protein [Candidatus Gastranaerophilales bacterium]